MQQHLASNMSHILLPLDLAAYALLSSYCLCGCLTEHFSVFRGWLAVHDRTHLKALQTASGHGVLFTYVVPKAILTVMNAYLVMHPPLSQANRGVVDGSLQFSLAMLGISWASSFLVQVPLQLRIRETGDRGLVARLYKTTWLRTVTMCLSVCSMYWLVFNEAFRA
ncbi:hypothetical protein CMUS01_07134 [Colletotrichum musicola]|uniref:Integral membrane protein n=1 Tax=Colletotrichum musicola TaxID=2175873 RepID=A0A8H6NGQ8_9PEZI|nr:hypothetical protein CMUS01_07134 [Colletotrichum musicola]